MENQWSNWGQIKHDLFRYLCEMCTLESFYEIIINTKEDSSSWTPFSPEETCGTNIVTARSLRVLNRVRLLVLQVNG